MRSWPNALRTDCHSVIVERAGSGVARVVRVIENEDVRWLGTNLRTTDVKPGSVGVGNARVVPPVGGDARGRGGTDPDRTIIPEPDARPAGRIPARAVVLHLNGVPSTECGDAHAYIHIHVGVGIPTFSAWHSIEVEYDRSGWNT